MVGPTGFEPLDLVIMESTRKMIEVRDHMKKYHLELSDALDELGYSLEDFTGNDLKTLISLDRY
jgi:hypothetical protein